MIHSPTAPSATRARPGRLPRGDFAAWCDRMFAERARPGRRLHKARVGHPDEDEELELAARKGREHEQRWLLGLRGREPGLSRSPGAKPCAAELTISAMRDAAPAIYQPHLVADGWQGHPTPLPLRRQRLRLPRLPLHAWTQARRSPSPTSWFSSAPTPTCSRPSGVPAHRTGLHPGQATSCGSRPPLLHIPAAQGSFVAFQA